MGVGVGSGAWVWIGIVGAALVGCIVGREVSVGELDAGSAAAQPAMSTTTRHGIIRRAMILCDLNKWDELPICPTRAHSFLGCLSISMNVPGLMLPPALRLAFNILMAVVQHSQQQGELDLQR